MPVNSFENYYMSWRPQKNNLKSPLYKSIANQLEFDIMNGYIAPNTKLPPQRELADFLDVNLSTITRAFKICESRGLIYAIMGSGTFVSQNARSSISITDNNVNKEYIDMSVIKPLDCCNQYALETIKKISEKNYLDKLLDYSHPRGIPYHRIATQKWMNMFGCDVPIENIAITSGGQNTILLALIALFEAGDKIAVDTFTYPNFIELAKMLSINLIPIESDSKGMIAEKLDKACVLYDIKGIYINSSCSNPTSILMEMDRRKELSIVIRKYNLILLEDDSYSFINPKGFLPISYFVPEQFVYMLSTSKALISGLRVGYIGYSNQFSSRIEKGIFNTNVKTSSLNAEIVTELINSGLAEEIIERKKELVLERNKLFDRYFENRNPNMNPFTFYRCVYLKNKYDLLEFEEGALDYEISIYHSNRFLTGKNDDFQFARVSLVSMSNIAELEVGLIRLRAYLKSVNEVI